MKAPQRPSGAPRWAPYLLGAIVLGGALAHLTGLLRLDPQALIGAVRDAGPLGALLLVLSFAVGTAVNVPGVIFVGAAVAVYGPCMGYLVALVGAVASVNVGFGLGRLAGLGSSRALEKPWMQKVVARLESHPVLALIVLRAVVMVSPPVNYALALTTLRHRDYALGSALGLVLPVWIASQGAHLIL